MAIFLSKRELAQTEPAERVAFRSPVPTRIVSNGEFNPLPQTQRQKQFEERLRDLAETNARKLGMDRRHFLRSSCRMAAAFVALNDVFGSIFNARAHLDVLFLDEMQQRNVSYVSRAFYERVCRDS